MGGAAAGADAGAASREASVDDGVVDRGGSAIQQTFFA
jgi:hypothetical protein